jgi:ubiquinone/menaquinone biosynthesis C-methylase UbiE
MDIDTLNQSLYERPEIVKDYTRHNKLWREEQIILQKYEPYLRDKAVLDVGCGGGRTTVALSELTGDYTGIDYSIQMIEACQKKYKNLKFLQGDASNMSMLAEAKFDFVLFSFNGIDCMSHAKRLKTLQEIYRVLKPGGVFAFSSHNRDDKRRVVAWDIRDLNLANNIRNLRSYLAVRKYQIRAKTYAILSDPLAGFGHLTYYIRKADQVRQLEEIGLQKIEILNQKAQWLEANTHDRESHWLHYVCQKPSQPRAKPLCI